jgi:hypothetical protein
MDAVLLIRIKCHPDNPFSLQMLTLRENNTDKLFGQHLPYAAQKVWIVVEPPADNIHEFLENKQRIQHRV